MDDKRLQEETRNNWYSIDLEKRKAIVAMLRIELDMDSFRAVMEENPVGWSIGWWHFSQGMGIRNLLREKGFKDQDLPEVEYPDGYVACNWDDFYTAALEAAAGVIDV